MVTIETTLDIIKSHFNDDTINTENYGRIKQTERSTIIYIARNDKFYKFTILNSDVSINENINENNISCFKGTLNTKEIKNNKYTYFVVENTKTLNLLRESVNIQSFIEKFGNFLLNILECCVNNDLIVGFIDPEQLTVDNKEIKLTDPTVLINDSTLTFILKGGEMKNMQEYAKIVSDKTITTVVEFIKSFNFIIIDRLFNFKNEESKTYALKALLLRYILLYYLLVMTREIKTYGELSAGDAGMAHDEQLRHFNSVFRRYGAFFSSFFIEDNGTYEHALMTLLNFLSFSPKEIFQLGEKPITFKNISFTKNMPDDVYNVIKTYHNEMDVEYKLNESINLSIISIVNRMKEMFSLDFTSSVLDEIGLNNKIIASHEVGILENSININEFNELKIHETLLYKPPLKDKGSSFPEKHIKIEDMKIMEFNESNPTYCLCSDIHGSVSKLIIFFIQTKLIKFKEKQENIYIFRINKDENKIKRYVLGDYLTIKNHVQTNLRDLRLETVVSQILTIISLIVAFHSTGKCVFLRGNHELIPVYKNVPLLRKLPLFKTLKLNNKIVILSHTSPYKALYNESYPQDAYKNIRDPDKASNTFLNDYQLYFDNLSKEYNYSTLETGENSPLTNKGKTLRYVLDRHGPYYHDFPDGAQGQENYVYNDKYVVNSFRLYKGNFMPSNLNILSIYGHDDSESFAYFDQNGVLQNKTGHFNSDGIFDTLQIGLSGDIHEKFAKQFGDEYLLSFSKTLTDYINDANVKTGALCIDTTSDFRSEEYDLQNTNGDPIGSLSTLGILVIQENAPTEYIALFVKSVLLSPHAKFKENNDIENFIGLCMDNMSDDDIIHFMDDKEKYMDIIGNRLIKILKRNLKTGNEEILRHIVKFETDQKEITKPTNIKCKLADETDINNITIVNYLENDHIKFSDGSVRKVRNLNKNTKIFLYNIDDETFKTQINELMNKMGLPNNDEELTLLVLTLWLKISMNIDNNDDVNIIIEKITPYDYVKYYNTSLNDFLNDKENTIPHIKVRGGDTNKNTLIFVFSLLIFTILITVVIVYLSSHNSSSKTISLKKYR